MQQCIQLTGTNLPIGLSAFFFAQIGAAESCDSSVRGRRVLCTVWVVGSVSALVERPANVDSPALGP